jgi:deoxyribodipyrimidine photolyase
LTAFVYHRINRHNPRQRLQARAVFCNEIAQAPHQAVARQVEAALASDGIRSQNSPGDLLAAPSNIRNKDNRALRVFTRSGGGRSRSATRPKCWPRRGS